MAKFCTICGGAIDQETGKCTACDSAVAPAENTAVNTADTEANEAPATAPENVIENTSESESAPALKFCTKCGNPMDPVTGKCLDCDAPTAAPVYEFGPMKGMPIAPEMPAPTVSYGKAEKAPRKKKPTALTVIITVILSFCLILTTVITYALFSVKNALTAIDPAKIVENLDFEEIVKDNATFDNEDLEKFYEKLDTDFGIKIDNKGLTEFIEDSSIKEFVVDKVSDFMNSINDKNATLEITKRDIVNLLKDNQKLIEKEFGVSLSTDEIKDISEMMFEGKDLELITMKDLKKDNSAIFDALDTLLSPTLSIFFAALCLIVFLIMLLNSPSQGSICGGIIFIVIGVLTGSVSLLAGTITPALSGMVGGKLIAGIVSDILSANFIISAVIFGIGIVSIITRIIVKIAVGKKG